MMKKKLGVVLLLLAIIATLAVFPACDCGGKTDNRLLSQA